MARILRHFDVTDALPVPNAFGEIDVPANIKIFTYDNVDYVDIKFEDSPGVIGYQMVRVSLDELKDLFPCILRHTAKIVNRYYSY